MIGVISAGQNGSEFNVLGVIVITLLLFICLALFVGFGIAWWERRQFDKSIKERDARWQKSNRLGGEEIDTMRGVK